MSSTAQFFYPEALVTTDWLAAHLNEPGLRVFDCTTYLVYETGTGRPLHDDPARISHWFGRHSERWQPPGGSDRRDRPSLGRNDRAVAWSAGPSRTS